MTNLELKFTKQEMKDFLIANGYRIVPNVLVYRRGTSTSANTLALLPNEDVPEIQDISHWTSGGDHPKTYSNVFKKVLKQKLLSL